MGKLLHHLEYLSLPAISYFKHLLITLPAISYILAAYLATSLGFAPNTAQHAECQAVVASLYEVFIKKECTLLEINPLVETANGTVSILNPPFQIKSKQITVD